MVAANLATAAPKPKPDFHQVKPFAFNLDQAGCTSSKWVKGQGDSAGSDPKDKHQWGLVLTVNCDTDVELAGGKFKNVKGLVIAPGGTDEFAYDIFGGCPPVANGSPQILATWRDDTTTPPTTGRAVLDCFSGFPTPGVWETRTYTAADFGMFGGEILLSIVVFVNDNDGAGGTQTYRLDDFRVNGQTVGRP